MRIDFTVNFNNDWRPRSVFCPIHLVAVCFFYRVLASRPGLPCITRLFPKRKERIRGVRSNWDSRFHSLGRPLLLGQRVDGEARGSATPQLLVSTIRHWDRSLLALLGCPSTPRSFLQLQPVRLAATATVYYKKSMCTVTSQAQTWTAC